MAWGHHLGCDFVEKSCGEWTQPGYLCRGSGELSRIQVVPISDGLHDEDDVDARRTKEKAVLDSFATLDAAKSISSKKEDQQSLLAIVEAGFGHLHAFNKFVRKVRLDARGHRCHVSLLTVLCPRLHCRCLRTRSSRRPSSAPRSAASRPL